MLVRAAVSLAPLTAVGLALTGAAAPMASAAATYSFDTGAGLTVAIDAGTGNITSLRHDGVELGRSGRVGQVDSGWRSATVTQTTYDNGKAVLWSAAIPTETQYYFMRKGDNTIYMATNITAQVGLARFIARLDTSVLPNSSLPAKTNGAESAVEGSDVFRFADGTTASKFYSSQRLIEQKAFGATGDGHGVFIIPGRQELSSGGPFWRDHEVNNSGTDTNLTQVMYSDHAQTEASRIGLHGPYAMTVTDGGKPSGVNMEFLSAYIPGLLAKTQRGTVTGTATGDWGKQRGTVALSGDAGQYWARVGKDGFTIAKVRPGTYTATLYAGELAVGSTVPVTVTAGSTSTVSLTGNVPAAGTLFQIGTWDGTPAGFLNADKIETMHPSDVRMSSWDVDQFTVGAKVRTFPMALFKDGNSGIKVNFSLSSVPTNGVTLRIGSTLSFAGGRPAIVVNDWSSNLRLSPTPRNLNSRGVTRGTWRGVNQTFTFPVPASALKAGTNTLTIHTISGSSGSGFLSPNFVVDALSLDPS